MDDPLYKAAINYLSYRPRTVREVEIYLQKKQVSDDRLIAIITLLRKQKFVDDTQFARMWIHSRYVGRPKSQSFIKRELKEKGVAEVTIERVFLETQDERKSDFDQAVLLLEKKKKQFNSLEKDALYRRANGYLFRRGFSFDVICKSIDQVFQK